MPDRRHSIDLLEGIATARTIRRYRPEPIPEDDLGTILWSATRAPSGTNRQPFRFLVLRDGPRGRAARALLGEAFRAGWAEKSGTGDSPGTVDPRSKRGRNLAAMQHFVDHFEQIPVVVLACYIRYRPLTHFEGASVFPACQNLLLAARALGYGACFSSWHLRVERELRELLEIPDRVELSLCITLGRPEGSHGPVRRKPVRELVFEERWDEPAPWIDDPAGAPVTRHGIATPPRPAGD